MGWGMAGAGGELVKGGRTQCETTSRLCLRASRLTAALGRERARGGCHSPTHLSSSPTPPYDSDDDERLLSARRVVGGWAS